MATSDEETPEQRADRITDEIMRREEERQQRQPTAAELDQDFQDMRDRFHGRGRYS